MVYFLYKDYNCVVYTLGYFCTNTTIFLYYKMLHFQPFWYISDILPRLRNVTLHFSAKVYILKQVLCGILRPPWIWKIIFYHRSPKSSWLFYVLDKNETGIWQLMILHAQTDILNNWLEFQLQWVWSYYIVVPQNTFKYIRAVRKYE